MYDNLLISVIIPCFNAQDYIANTVNNVCQQLYKNLEIILVDDGSNDNTGLILDELKNTDNRIIVYHKENAGVSKARLFGVEHANGDYIAFVDADDELEPDMYLRLTNNAIKYQADISHCGYKRITPNREREFFGTQKLKVQDNQTGLIDLLEGKIIEPGLWNKLYKKSLFSEILSGKSPMDFSIKYTEDLLMNYYLFKEAQKSVFEDFCGYRYIVRENSVSNSGMNLVRLSDPMKVIKNMLKDSKKNIPVHNVIRNKYVRELISVSIHKYNKKDELFKSASQNSVSELRHNLILILKDKGISTKLKLMGLITTISPSLYRKIHEVYNKITGMDKFYD